MVNSSYEMFEDLSKRIIAAQRRLAKSEAGRVESARAYDKSLDDVFLGIIDVIDLLERLSESESQPVAFNKVVRRLTALLKRFDVHDFVPAHTEPGRVKVIETRSLADHDEGAILGVSRKGYRRGERVLRPAEVISNRLG